MKVRSAISKVMNIKEGEGPTILLLITFSFFLGIGLAFYYTATTTLLLVNFEREILPFAYIGGGVVVYLLSLAFAQLQKRVKASTSLLFVFIFLIISVAILLALYMSSGNKWITFVLFIWMRVLAYVQGTSFWGLASRIFNLEQGKRHFGLISAGEVVSHILSFFSVPFLLKVINTEDLLYLSLAGLGLSLVFMFIIVKKFSGKLAVKGESRKEIKKSPRKKSSNLFKNKYFSLIFILAFIPMFANFIVDFIFLTQTKQIFTDKEVLSGFIAIFFGVTAITEFITKTFVSGRIIKEYGIKMGLSSLPFLLGICTLLAIVAGTVFGPTGLFFSFILMGKLFMRAIRTSIYEPSFQILFQPVPKDMRLAFLSKIEGGPKAFGNIIAGGVLLLFTSFGFITLVHFNYLLLLVVAFWLYSSIRMSSEYRNTLSKLISGGAQLKQSIISSKSGSSIIKSAFNTSNPHFFKLLVKLLDKLDPTQKLSMLTNILGCTTNRIKKIILSIIREKRMIEIRTDLEEEVKKDESAELLDDFNETIRILNETEKISFDKIEALVNSSDPSERVSAAVLLGKSGRYNAPAHIIELSKDENRKVKEEALIAAGHIKNHELWSIILSNLVSPDFVTTVCAASRNLGSRILNDLDHFYHRMADDKHVQLRIIKLYEEIGGKHALNLLRSGINSPDKEIRDKTLDSLCKMKYTVSIREKPVIRKSIEEDVSDIVYLNASLLDFDSFNEDEDIIKALHYELRQKRQKIFNLLSVLYDPKTIQYIREVLDEDSKESQVFALEILDMLLSEDLKSIIMSLFVELPEEEFISKYRPIFPQETLSIPNRLCDIINKDRNCISNWTRSNAIRLLENYPSEKAARVLAANIIHPDLLIRDTALRSLHLSDIEKFNKCVRMLKIESRKMIRNITSEMLAGNGNHSLYLLDKIKILSSIHFLNNIQEPVLVKLTYDSKSINYSKDEKISIDENYFMVILKGRVRLMDIDTVIKTLNVKDIIGEISPDYLRNPNAKYIADEEVIVLQISLDLLFELMFNHVAITESLVHGLMIELSENLQQKKSESYV